MNAYIVQARSGREWQTMSGAMARDEAEHRADELRGHLAGPIRIVPKWCPDCPHEFHEPHRCSGKMSWRDAAVRAARRGLPLTEQPTCECDHREVAR